MKNKICRLIAALLVSLGTAPSFAADSPVAGDWISARRSKGGIGKTLTFTDDGRIVDVVGAIVNAKWRTLDAENALVLDFPKGAGETPVRYSYVLREQGTVLELSAKGTAQKRTILKRTAGTGESVRGKWTYKHETGGDAFMEFAAPDDYFFTLPMTRKEGVYSAQNNIMTIQMKGAAPNKYRYAVEPSRLRIGPTEKSKAMDVYFRK